MVDPYLHPIYSAFRCTLTYRLRSDRVIVAVLFKIAASLLVRKREKWFSCDAQAAVKIFYQTHMEAQQCR